MFLKFEQLVPQSQQVIDNYLKDADNITSDYSVAALLLWTSLTNSQYATTPSALFIKGEYNGESIFFSPLCKDEFYLQAVEDIKQYAKQNQIPFKMFFVLRHQIEMLLTGEGCTLSSQQEVLQSKSFKTKNFCFVNDRNLAEYIYLPEKIINLAGGEYKHKRRAIAAFNAKYLGRYSYRLLCDEDIDDIVALHHVWNAFKKHKTTDEEDNLLTLLKNRQQLGITGYVFVVDGNIVACSLLQKTASGVGIELYEKCKPAYRDAYTLLNQLEAQELSDCRYINMEDDVGLEGLRTSKLSYKPEFLLEKFILSENYEDELKQLYQKVFNDSDEFTDEIFSENCQCSSTALEMEDDKIVSCGFIRYKKIMVLNQMQDMPFIYGLATDENYRHQGRAKCIMTRLLNMIASNNQGVVALYPHPVSRQFYEKMGFVNFNYTKKFKLKDAILANTEFIQDDNPDVEMVTEIFNLTNQGYTLAQFRQNEDTRRAIKELQADGGNVVFFHHKNYCYGYMMCTQDEIDEIVIDQVYVESIKNKSVNQNNIPKELKRYLDFSVELAQKASLKKLSNICDGDIVPYNMFRVVDSYQFILNFVLPFIDTSQNAAVNLMVKDDMLNNSFLNIRVEDGIASVDSVLTPNCQEIILSVSDLAQWALGIVEVEHMPKINGDQIIAKYKDTY